MANRRNIITPKGKNHRRQNHVEKRQGGPLKGCCSSALKNLLAHFHPFQRLSTLILMIAINYNSLFLLLRPHLQIFSKNYKTLFSTLFIQSDF